MTETAQLIAIFIAAVNPAAVALAAGRFEPRTALAGGLGALALLAVAAFAADAFLDALDIEPETFRIAAGVVLLASGAVVIWRARAGALEPEGSPLAQALSPIAFPLLFSPAVAAAALSYGADDGPAKTILAGAIGLILAVAGLALGPGRARPVLDGVARLLGALLVAVAAGLIVEGVRDI
ncbi:MAG: MarC family protein [Dehalococcoidia bacterium]